jgi:hypothetical protein
MHSHRCQVLLRGIAATDDERDADLNQETPQMKVLSAES